MLIESTSASRYDVTAEQSPPREIELVSSHGWILGISEKIDVAGALYRSEGMPSACIFEITNCGQPAQIECGDYVLTVFYKQLELHEGDVVRIDFCAGTAKLHWKVLHRPRQCKPNTCAAYYSQADSSMWRTTS